MENNGPEFSGRDELLAAARREHHAYYRGASESDAASMDLLVVLRAALVLCYRASRADVPESVKMGFERTADAKEGAFMAAV